MENTFSVLKMLGFTFEEVNFKGMRVPANNLVSLAGVLETLIEDYSVTTFKEIDDWLEKKNDTVFDKLYAFIHAKVIPYCSEITKQLGYKGKPIAVLTINKDIINYDESDGYKIEDTLVLTDKGEVWIPYLPCSNVIRANTVDAEVVKALPYVLLSNPLKTIEHPELDCKTWINVINVLRNVRSFNYYTKAEINDRFN